jgi:hypothetical protein
MKWYPKGDSKGTERYCARTVDGRPVDSGSRLTVSQAAKSGLCSSVVKLSNSITRGRINEELTHPGEACY